VQSLRATFLDDVSATGGAQAEVGCRSARGGARVLTGEQMFFMARGLCLDNSDRPRYNARPRRDAARVGQNYLLQDDDDVDEDDDDDDDVDNDDDDDAETDEDEPEDEEEEEETWQVSAIAPFR
jgi:hypothetical protein